MSVHDFNITKTIFSADGSKGTHHMPVQITIESAFGTTAILLILFIAAILIIYISCFAWVFKVTLEISPKICTNIEFQGNLDMPRPIKREIA